MTIKNYTQLTNNEFALICGTLLGDSTLIKRGNSHRMRVLHCVAQKELVDWKYNNLKRLCTTTQPPTVKNGKHPTYLFYLSSGLYLKQIYDVFYKKTTLSDGTVKDIKTITPELLDFLPVDPMVLAVLFMDDGSARNDCYAGRIALHGFSYDEQLLFHDYVKKNYSIKLTMNRHTKYHSTCINAPDFPEFINIVKPIINQVPCMQYKLNELRKINAKNL